jgi:hypothetical protein
MITLPDHEDAMPLVALSRALASLWGVPLIATARVVVAIAMKIAGEMTWGQRIGVPEQNLN